MFETERDKPIDREMQPQYPGIFCYETISNEIHRSPLFRDDLVKRNPK